MADLFDMNVGGVGFHFTCHVIAITALFIACFAIAGYISFRDDSIPGDALKKGADGHNNIIRIVDIPVMTGNEHVDFTFIQPENTVIDSVHTIVAESYTSDNITALELKLGTKLDGAEILVTATIEGAVGDQVVNTNNTYKLDGTDNIAVMSRTVYGRIKPVTGTKITVPGKMEVIFMLHNLPKSLP